MLQYRYTVCLVVRRFGVTQGCDRFFGGRFCFSMAGRLLATSNIRIVFGKIRRSGRENIFLLKLFVQLLVHSGLSRNRAPRNDRTSERNYNRVFATYLIVLGWIGLENILLRSTNTL